MDPAVPIFATNKGIGIHAKQGCCRTFRLNSTRFPFCKDQINQEMEGYKHITHRAEEQWNDQFRKMAADETYIAVHKFMEELPKEELERMRMKCEDVEGWTVNWNTLV